MTKSTTSPYSTQPLSSPIQRDMYVGGQVERYKDDEKTQKAPTILPQALDAANEILSEMYIQLMKFKKIIRKAENEPSLNSGKLEAINMLIDTLGKQILNDIPSELDKLAL